MFKHIKTRSGHPDNRVAVPLSDRRGASSSKSIQANAFATAKRGYERYVALAKTSSISGDAIETENYYQHAEHYLRSMRE
jgi:hypothetical protein